MFILVILGNTVPITFLDLHHNCSDLTTDATPTLNQECDTAFKDDSTRIIPKKRRKKRVIPPLTSCLKCKKEIKGKCSQCTIKELKMIIKEKEKLLKIKDKQLKIAQTESKYVERRLKDRLKVYRKKLDTSKRRFTRMGKYAKVKNEYPNIFHFSN